LKKIHGLFALWPIASNLLATGQCNRYDSPNPNNQLHRGFGPVKRILFVCLGNICRSPAAQGIAQWLIEQRGWTDCVSVDSAGTSNYQAGRPADPLMQRAAQARGYQLLSRSKQLNERMIRENGLVIAMDRENYREIHLISRGEMGHIRLLSEFLDDRWPRDVPDPYRGPEQGFEFVLDMLESALPAILDSIPGLESSK
jgi:protein-tyrosine phosphatase